MRWKLNNKTHHRLKNFQPGTQYFSRNRWKTGIQPHSPGVSDSSLQEITGIVLSGALTGLAGGGGSSGSRGGYRKTVVTGGKGGDGGTRIVWIP